jgi:hypothetical protein
MSEHLKALEGMRKRAAFLSCYPPAEDDPDIAALDAAIAALSQPSGEVGIERAAYRDGFFAASRRQGMTPMMIAAEWEAHIATAAPPQAASQPSGEVAEMLAQLDGDLSFAKKRDNHLNETCLVWKSTLQRARDLIASTAAPPQAAKGEAFCDGNCVWTDHHPDCPIAADDRGGEVEALLQKWLVRYNELIQMDRTHEAEQVLRCLNDAKRAAALIRQRAAAGPAVAWQPMSAAPKDSSRFLACTVNGYHLIVYWRAAGGWFSTPSCEWTNLARWMPLPAAALSAAAHQEGGR